VIPREMKVKQLIVAVSLVILI